MIEESDYKSPKLDQKRHPTEAERQRAKETLEYLESLPYRPFGLEW